MFRFIYRFNVLRVSVPTYSAHYTVLEEIFTLGMLVQYPVVNPLMFIRQYMASHEIANLSAIHCTQSAYQWCGFGCGSDFEKRSGTNPAVYFCLF